MKITHSRISIGNLYFQPFNHIRLENVYVADLKGDTLLYAATAIADFNLLTLFDNRLSIHSIEVRDFTIALSKDSANAPFNFQFLIDAFSPDRQSPDSSTLTTVIDKLYLKHGRLRYDIFSEPYLSDGLFDANHICIQDVNTEIHLKSLELEKADISVVSLSFKERSGFVLKQSEMSLKSDKKTVTLNHLAISLPHSELSVKEAWMDYSGKNPDYALNVAGRLSPEDFKYFYPNLVRLPDAFTFSGKIDGTFPEISLHGWQIDCGKLFQLRADAALADVYRWENTPFELSLERLYFNKTGLICFASLFSENTQQADEWPFNIEPVSIYGKAGGALPDWAFVLNVESKQGDLTLKGNGGYQTTKEIKAHIDADIRQLDYLDYTYQNIQAEAQYHNDSLSVLLVSKDAHLPLNLSAKACLRKENPSAHVYARLHRIRPDSLHWLPQYPGAELSAIVTADVKGFDPESMMASITVDSLKLSTHNGSFEDSPVSLSYYAGSDRQKQFNIRSRILNARGKGQLTCDETAQAVQQAFPNLFPKKKRSLRKGKPAEEVFNYYITLHQANTLTHLLGIDAEILDSAFVVGKYENHNSRLNLNTTAVCLFGQSDTTTLNLNLSNNQNNLAIRLDVNNRSDDLNLDGSLEAEIEFVSSPLSSTPNLNIDLKPGAVTVNENSFLIYPAQINIQNKRYEINNFALRHSTSEYLKINGIVSDEPADSLVINISRFQLGTFLSVLNNDLSLSGIASGDVMLSQAMTAPLVRTRNFTIDRILFDENEIGKLNLVSAWSSERHGLVFRATLNNTYAPESVLSGMILPDKDSLSLNGHIEGIQLKWFTNYFPETLYGLGGELGAKIKVNGKITHPALTGTLHLKEVTAGVKTLNALYRVSDSIFLEPDRILFKEFIVYDETKRNGKINGVITHQQFSKWNPKLTIDFNNLLVLNNERQTDNLFYGILRVNGSLNVTSHNKDWLVQGNLKAGKTNRLTFNIPESPAEAQRYKWLSFVDTKEEKPDQPEQKVPTKETPAFSLPVKLHVALSIDPNINLGVIINPATKDAAQVTGAGILDFSYDLNNSAINLQGNYEIEDGKCTFSLKNITRKAFSVQKGGRLNFRGDPLNTSFNVTAIYNLRADLTTLDPSFANFLTTTKTPVNCLLTANGNLKNMQLNYNIHLPNESEEVQRKLSGLMYTDEIKIKEIAYLLAFGSFLPLNSNDMNSKDSNIWTSLASSSITTQLNNLLSGVLKDNWTIGTDLHTKDTNFSEVDMDVNISTRLFDNRLTVNSTLGYHNNLMQNENFTGDFDLEYKLSPNGNVLLRFFNVTNNQYYDKSKATTQGVGIVYKREGRTFRQLFRSFRTKKK